MGQNPDYRGGEAGSVAGQVGQEVREGDGHKHDEGRAEDVGR